jgi:signal transduction histidine kinase
VWLGWFTNWCWMPAQAFALLLVLHFPDGTLPSRRWRPLKWAVWAWTGVACVTGALVPGPLGAEQLEPLRNPVGLDPAAAVLNGVLSGLFFLLPLLVVLTALAPVVRWRRSGGEQRRQINGVMVGILLVVASVPFAVATDTAGLVEGLAWLLLPAAIAHAVLRRRLWDVDLRRRFDRIRAVRDEERTRLRHDLHDTLGPILGSISMRSEATRNLVAAGAAQQAIEEQLTGIDRAARTAVVEVRRILDELAPSALDDADLHTAVQELLDGHSASGTRFTLSSEPLPELEPRVESAAYRVVAEAVQNVVRHARANQCRVSLSVVDDRLCMEVVDDGRGLGGAVGGVGRRSMSERVAALSGEFAIEEPAGGGVRISASFPGAVA